MQQLNLAIEGMTRIWRAVSRLQGANAGVHPRSKKYSDAIGKVVTMPEPTEKTGVARRTCAVVWMPGEVLR